MTTNSGLEQRLSRMLAVPLSASASANIGQRVRAAMTEPAAPSRRQIPGRSLAVLGLAAVLLLGTAAGIDVFSRIMGGGGASTAWSRATHLGLHTTANGQEVILQGAYADAGQMVVGVSAPNMPDIANYSGLWVTDAAGIRYWPSMGTGTNEVDGSVMVYTFLPDQPLPAGERQFTVTMRSNGMAEPWVFHFPLTVASGTSLALDASATAAGLTVRVTHVTISPTIARVALSVSAGSGPGNGNWAPIAFLSHDGTEIPLEGASSDLTSLRGVDDPSGHWELVVKELVANERVAGPWVIPFDIP